MEKVGLVILTLNAGDTFFRLLDSLANQKFTIEQSLIVDSGSVDNTVEIAKQHKFPVVSIEKSRFNHGGTRQWAAKYLKDMDIVIFLTQDVILYDEDSLSCLVRPFENPQVGAVYGRQLPHKGASLLAAQVRLFNYPPQSQLKSYKDKEKLGMKTAFLSDSFAAYRIKALEEVGGFPQNVIIAEDMYVAAKMLLQKYQIAYAADACVYHSHDYTLIEEFKRYFDAGVFQSQQPWIRKAFGNAEGEGLKLVFNQIKYLREHRGSLLIPKAIASNVLKLIGYRLGLYEKYLPVKLKKVLSGQSYFF